MGEATVNMESLQKIFASADDITDPHSMRKISKVLKQIRKEDNDYMKLLVEKLQSETINWPQPWYQKSTCLTRKPKDPAGKYEKYKTGSFTHEECKRMKKNYTTFARHFNIPNTPLNFARWRNRKHSRNAMLSKEEFVRCFVVAYVAKDLKRNLYQVNSNFLKTYAYPTKFRTYTPLEEKIMEICFYHDPDNAVTILSAVLGREPRGLYNKLFEYFNGEPEKKRLKWNLPLATKFLNSLMLHSGCSLKELKNKKFGQAVWLKLQEDMGQQYQHLQAFWYGKLQVQIFAQCTVKTKSLRYVICNLLKDSPYQKWSDIRWRKLARMFPDGITPQFLHRITRYLFEKNPDYLTSPLPEVIAKAKRINKKCKVNRRLKSVDFKEGNLKYVRRQGDLADLMLQK